MMIFLPSFFFALSFSTLFRSRARQTTMVETRSASATPTRNTRLQSASPKLLNYADIHKHGFKRNDSEKSGARPVPFTTPSPMKRGRGAHNDKKKKAKKTTANGGDEEEKEEEARLHTIKETEMEGEDESEKEEEERGGGGGEKVIIIDTEEEEEEKEKEKERTETVDVGEPSDATRQRKTGTKSTGTTTASTGKEANELSKAPSSNPLSPNSKFTNLKWKDDYKEYFHNAVFEEYVDEEDSFGEYMLTEDFYNGKVSEHEFKRSIAANVMTQVVKKLECLKKEEEGDSSKKKTRSEIDQLEAYAQLAWDPTDVAKAYHNDLGSEEKEKQIVRFTVGLKGRKSGDADGIFGEESFQQVSLKQRHTTGTKTEHTSKTAKVIRAIHPFLKKKSWTCNRADIIDPRNMGNGWPKPWSKTEEKKKEERNDKERTAHFWAQKRKKANFKANFQSSEKLNAEDERYEERRTNEEDVEKEEDGEDGEDGERTVNELLEEDRRKRKQLKTDRKSLNTSRGGVAWEDDLNDEMKAVQEQQNNHDNKEGARQDALLEMRRQEIQIQQQHLEISQKQLEQSVAMMRQQQLQFEVKQKERAAQQQEEREKFLAQLRATTDMQKK